MDEQLVETLSNHLPFPSDVNYQSSETLVNSIDSRELQFQLVEEVIRDMDYQKISKLENEPIAPNKHQIDKSNCFHQQRLQEQYYQEASRNFNSCYYENSILQNNDCHRPPYLPNDFKRFPKPFNTVNYQHQQHNNRNELSFTTDDSSNRKICRQSDTVPQPSTFSKFNGDYLRSNNVYIPSSNSSKEITR